MEKNNKTEVFHARLTPAQKRRLRKRAEKENTTMSKLIQKMIDDFTEAGHTDMANAVEFMNAHPATRPLLQIYTVNEKFLQDYPGLLPPEARPVVRDFMTMLYRTMAQRAAKAADDEHRKMNN